MGPPHGLLHAKKATLPGLHLQPGEGPFPAAAYFVFLNSFPKEPLLPLRTGALVSHV